MAKVRENALINGIRGHVGKQYVIRETNGQPIVTNIPKHTKKKPTEKQEDQFWKFRAAAKKASIAIKDPEKLKRYEAARKPGWSAYNVAFSEYLTMFVAGKKEPTPLPPQPRKVIHKMKTKNITLLLDTDKGTIVKSALAVPDEYLGWLKSTAEKITSEKVRNIVFRVTCG